MTVACGRNGYSAQTVWCLVTAGGPVIKVAPSPQWTRILNVHCVSRKYSIFRYLRRQNKYKSMKHSEGGVSILYQHLMNMHCFKFILEIKMQAKF